MGTRDQEHDDTATVPRARLDEEGAIEVGSSMFLDDGSGPPARSDLYALGVTLYEMLSGLRPIAAPDRTSLFAKQRTEARSAAPRRGPAKGHAPPRSP